jgi:flavin-dependent dehydrogenase
MIKRARELGVEVIQRCRASKIMVASNRIAGIQTNIGELKADFVIDATGSRQWLAKHAQIAVRRWSSKLIACYGYVSGDRPITESAVPAMLADDCGWTWTAPVGRRTLSWTRLNFCTQTRCTVPKEVSIYKRLRFSGAADVTWRQVTSAAGAGYFIIGDAATVLDPSSSNGILRAVMSGIKAARAIINIYRGLPEHLAALEFSTWIARSFTHNANILKALYRRHPNPPRWLQN